jgi:hypothetical protein
MAMTAAVQSKARTVLAYSNTVIESSITSGGTDKCPHSLYLCACPVYVQALQGAHLLCKDNV